MAAALVFAVALSAYETTAHATDAPELRVIDWCDLPGNTCAPCEDEQGEPLPPEECGGQPVTWCCLYNPIPGSPACTEVVSITECDPWTEYAVICDWGEVHEDGSVTCYG